MAGFKTHVSVGAGTGFAVMIATYTLGWSNSQNIEFTLFFATIVGSFLPDMDSDSGLPHKIIFGAYSFIAAAVTYFVLHDNNMPLIYVITLPIAVFLCIKYAIGPLFKKYTTHRGIFHSIPAIFIAFFATLLIVSFMRYRIMDKFLISLAVACGYFSHLLLDEIYSVNLLAGKSKRKRRKSKKRKKFSIKTWINKRFGTKRSFGTALEFTKKSKLATFFAYALLAFLIYINFPLVKKIYYMVIQL